MANNAIDLIVSKNAVAELQKTYELLGKTHEEIVKISKVQLDFSGGSSPKNLREVNAAIKTYTENQKEVSAIEKERIRVSKQLEATQAKIATATDKNTQELNKQKTALKTLGSAYLDLSQKQAESARRVQDLIARGKTATQTQKQYNNELKAAQNEFNKLNQRVLKADSAVGKFNRNVGNYPQQAVSGIKDLMGAFGILGGLGLAAGIATDIFKTTKELQSLDLALKQVTETDAKFAESQAFLRDISERFGIEINGLTKQFTQFYVSAKDKISGKEIQNIFESVSKAAGFMGLSVEQQERAFVALNQMMSKGTVTAEELKGQLGEALPGAFGIMAKALNVNERQLGEMMKQGNVLASDVLPKFAKALEKAYGIENKDRVESLAASTSRLSNSWTNFIRELNEGSGIVSNFFATITDEISKTIDAWTKFLSLSGTTKQVFDKKTAEGYNSTLQSLQEQADKYGITLVEQAKRTQELALKQREQAKNERDYLIQRRNGYNEAKEIARTLIGQANRITVANDLIKESTKSYGYWNGVIKATNQVIKTGKTTLDDDSLSTVRNTEEKKKNAKARKELEQVETNSAEAFNRNIAALEDQIKKVSRLNNETGELNPTYTFLEFTLLSLKKAYEALYGEQKKQEEITKRQIKYGTEEYFEDRIKALKEEQSQLADSTEQYQLYNRAIQSVQIQLDLLRGKTDEAKEATKDFADYFKGFVDEFGSNAGFSKMLFLFSEDFKKFEGNAKASALAISDAFQEAFNTINSYSEANYQKELSRLSNQKDLAIQFAGDSSAAKEEIERQYEAKRKQIERQRAEQAKRAAIFNAVIDTAQAVVATLAATPPPAGIPLAVLVGALGAAQIALIASQPIPAYAEGTLNHSGGAMLINDGKGSNYTETVVTPDGKAKQYKGRNVLVDAPKGTKVFTHNQWNEELNSMLNLQGIGYANRILPNIDISGNGLTKEDLSSEISRLANVIRSKASIEIVRDARGERIYQKEQGQRKEILNARAHIKGFDV